jgi:hypothetical protein
VNSSNVGSDGGVHLVGRALQIFKTGYSDLESHRQVLGIVTDTMQFYPSFSPSKTLPPLYFYRVSKSGVKGFVYQDQVMTSVYSITFPQDEVLETYYHDAGGSVASLGRVVGRDVLYKYLNSNVAPFITLKEGEASSTLFVYLIDLVSGTIHSKIAHYGAGNAIIGSGPSSQVHVVKSDNIVLYSFWNHGTQGVDPAFFPLQQKDATEDASKKKKRELAPLLSIRKSLCSNCMNPRSSTSAMKAPSTVPLPVIVSVLLANHSCSKIV